MNPIDEHQIRIAVQTLRLNDVGVKVLGGPDKEEARQTLKRFGWSEQQIKDAEK